jgi:hypothetical protein
MLLLGGCATLKHGGDDEIVVKSVNYEKYDGIDCMFTNEEGSWNSALGMEVLIERDGNTLNIECSNDIISKQILVEPAFEVGSLLADMGFFILGSVCIIACPIDMITNALYDYPDEIYVDFTNNNTLIIKEWGEEIFINEEENYKICGEVPRMKSKRSSWISDCHKNHNKN